MRTNEACNLMSNPVEDQKELMMIAYSLSTVLPSTGTTKELGDQKIDMLQLLGITYRHWWLWVTLITTYIDTLVIWSFL